MEHVGSMEHVGDKMTKTIAVIDGNSLMHRAYHAIQTPMSALDGTPTNAIFGFLQMFCKFIETAHPDAVVCAFDRGKPEYRIAEMPDYKAQRPHMDEELRAQFPVIEELLASMNVPVVTVPGWEGDDILGTIAARDELLGFKTLLVTGDKDACQLASELTFIVNTKKGISDVVILDPQAVQEKYGVTPSQFTDYLGLMGDSSDNIPGVAGVGPKTAMTMLQKYGDIEGIYEHIDEFKGKQRERLEENKDLAYLSRKIATIERDLDFPLDIEGISFPSFDKDSVEAAFKKYSLVSPLTRVLRLSDGNAAVHIETIEIEIGDITKGKDALALIEKAISNDEYIGFDYAVSDQPSFFDSDMKAAFSTRWGTAIIEGDAVRQTLCRIVRDGKLASIDIKEALQIIYPADNAADACIDEGELDNCICFDVALAAYLLDSTVTSYTYDGLVERYFGAKLKLPDNAQADVGNSDETIAVHASICRQLVDVLEGKLIEDGSKKVFDDIDMPLVGVLTIMERTGVEIDWERLKALGVSSGDEISALASEIYRISGEEFNIDSPKQLSHVLFEVMELEPIKKNARGYSTDATVLRELSKTQEIASLIIKYREYSKIKGTYIDNLPKARANDGRLHTHFHQTVTATGRLSSSDPNLQNIPIRSDFGRQIRECFIPLSKDDVFMSADYSQIELRLLAHLSGDENLIEAFNSNADFHAMTASRIFGVDLSDVQPEMRRRAKAVNFGIVYGQQAFGLAQSLDISRKEAQSMIDLYFEAYPKVESYLNDIVAFARKNGFAVTMFGRKRHIPDIHSSNKMRAMAAERMAMNHPMQGSGADIIKLAMIEVENRLACGGFKAQMLLQVHDELDLSVPEDEIGEVSELLSEAMSSVVELKVPLKADVSYGSNWAEAH